MVKILEITVIVIQERESIIFQQNLRVQTGASPPPHFPPSAQWNIFCPKSLQWVRHLYLTTFPRKGLTKIRLEFSTCGRSRTSHPPIPKIKSKQLFPYGDLSPKGWLGLAKVHQKPYRIWILILKNSGESKQHREI